MKDVTLLLIPVVDTTESQTIVYFPVVGPEFLETPKEGPVPHHIIIRYHLTSKRPVLMVDGKVRLQNRIAGHHRQTYAIFKYYYSYPAVQHIIIITN